MVREMACRKCKCITSAKICPACKSSDLTPNWNGIVLVVEPSSSHIFAKTSLGFFYNNQTGKYA